MFLNGYINKNITNPAIGQASIGTAAAIASGVAALSSYVFGNVKSFTSYSPLKMPSITIEGADDLEQQTRQNIASTSKRTVNVTSTGRNPNSNTNVVDETSSPSEGNGRKKCLNKIIRVNGADDSDEEHPGRRPQDASSPGENRQNSTTPQQPAANNSESSSDGLPKNLSNQFIPLVIGSLSFCLIPLLVATDALPRNWFLMLIYVLQGFGRGVFEASNRAAFGDFFGKTNKEGAFANVMIQSCLTSTIFFFANANITSVSQQGSIMEIVQIALGLAIVPGYLLSCWLSGARLSSS